ncbi:MAG: PIG-L family deacetylase [Hydrogenophaga sp.]|nr:PIG-L family deacetylase [Hydrogenophaga sp.]
MTALNDAKAWVAWLDRCGVERVVVISPHLDDAVFSMAGLLGAASHRTEVITLVTAARPGPASDWARATGFADNEAEYAARRQEDVTAMARLGCRYRHEGLSSGDLIAVQAREVARALDGERPGGLGRTLVLLPAGAGGPPPRSLLGRLVRRGLRRPVGALPHGDHVQTRDHFWHALAGSRARVGFYAELPYAWAQGNGQLQRHLHAALGCRTERVEHRPDVDAKRQLVELYRSQVLPIMGSPAYCRRVLSRPECLCVAELPAG